jgi:hypothetical protein
MISAKSCAASAASTCFLSHPSSTLTNGVVYTLMEVFAVAFVVRVFLTPGMKGGTWGDAEVQYTTTAVRLSTLELCSNIKGG